MKRHPKLINKLDVLELFMGFTSPPPPEQGSCDGPALTPT